MQSRCSAHARYEEVCALAGIKMLIEIIAIIGILVSIYGLYIEKRKNRDRSYKPICDISRSVNCTRALTSSFGKHFGIPNTVFGIFFYLLIIILNLYNFKFIVFLLGILGAAFSVYLACILYFKIKDLCLVCTSAYAINAAILVISIINLM